MSKINLFKLYASLVLDTSEYDNGIEQAGEKASKFSGVLSGGLATAAKVGAVALGAATTALGVLGKAAIQNYADFEQLSGGIETLFKDSADSVMQYASEAFKTAGMSANEYMDTVTSFSASLIASVGGNTAVAAEKANKAITDMADNANKMGTSMESIQNAYQGFAKQNYTMLDNLKLGYGGTKQEMERLIETANKINAQQGINTQYTIDSYADIVDAIHTVQTEMGITGTTAAEAASTISGSVNAMKAAWSNLVVGLADDNADIDALIDNFADSAVTAADNIIPRVEKVMSGIGTLIGKLAPVISEKLPEMINEVLPSLLSAGTQLVAGIATGIVSALPDMVNAFFDSIPMILQAIVDALPSLIAAGNSLIDSILTGISEKLPEVLSALVDFAFNAGVEIVKGIWNGIVSLFLWLGEQVDNLIISLFNTVFGTNFDKFNDFETRKKNYGSNVAAKYSSATNDGDTGVGYDSVPATSSTYAKQQANNQYNQNNGDIYVNINQTVGGRTVSQNQYKYDKDEATRRGVSLVGGAT